MENESVVAKQSLMLSNIIPKEEEVDDDGDENIYLDINQVLEVSLNEKDNKEKMDENEYIVSSVFRLEPDTTNLQETSQKNWVIENDNYVNQVALKSKEKLVPPSVLKQQLEQSPLNKPYCCSICRKGFSRKDHLRRHEQAHTGVTPFECHECGKSFNRRDRLTRHKLIHDGQYSYHCDVCLKLFTRKDHLDTHRRTHIREQAFLCNFCNKTFSRKDHLTVHKKSHTS